MSASLCIFCRARDFDQVADRCRDSSTHQVVRCRACGLVQLSPTPSSDDQDQFHALDLQSKPLFDASNLDVIRTRKVEDVARRAGLVREHALAGASILDVGSGYGVLLAELFGAGYRATGVEPSEERRAISRSISDAPLVDATLFDLPYSIGRFDVVLLSHVLEHLVEPVRAVGSLVRFVAPGGCLIVEVPNVDDMLLGASEAYRAFYWQRAHVSYFSPATLQGVLREGGGADAGIHVTGVQRYGLDNLMSWVVTGKPQIPIASFQTTGPYGWLEDAYKQHLQQSLRCDTLVAVVKA